MTSIVRWSSSFRLVVVALAVAVVLVGATQLPRMPVDPLPEFSPPYVEVQTEALGLSAAEVEQFITVPLEVDLLSGVAWVDTIRSESITGLSSITLIFEPGTDLMRARQVVAERLTQAHALPNVSKPPAMIQPLSSASRVMIVGLSSESVSPIQLSVLARWTVRPRLMGVAGVANVAIWGQRERQLQVQVDPERLNTSGVTLDQVIRTTGNALWVSPLSYINASTPGSGGFIDTPNQRIGIRHVLPIRTPEDLARVPIEGSDRRLGQVAEVVEDHQPLIGDAHTGGTSQLLLVIEKLPEANTLEVSRGVDAALEAMSAGLAGVRVDTTLYRPASFAEAAISTYSLAALIAALLVAGAVALMLRGWRAAVVTLTAVVLSVVAAAVILWALGATLNAVVIAGLVAALAVVIDDAVVGASELQRRGRQQVAGRRAMIESLARTTAAVRGPLLYATVIAALLVVPLLVLDRELGAFVRPFAVAWLAAIFASLVVAVSVTPVLTLLLRPQPRRGPRSVTARMIERGYEMRIVRLMLHPARALVLLLVVLVIGAATLPVLSTSLMPQFRERDLLIDVATAPGASRPEINRIVSQATAELESLPGVEDVGAHTGRAVMSDAVVGMDSAQMWVNVDPEADYDATVASIREVVDGYPGLSLEVGSYLTGRAESVLPADDKTVSMNLYGPDLAVLQQEAAKVRDAVTSLPGVERATIEQEAVEPQIEVEVDIATATEYGLKPGDVRRQAATLLSGLEVGNLFEDQKIFEVVVWGVPDIRHSVSSINELRIDTPSGEQVRLDDLAEVRIAATPSTIRREGISRRIEITALVAGRDRNAVAADMQALANGMALPREYHAEVVAETGAPDFGAAGVAGIAALIGILLVLQAALGSWRLAALTLVLLAAAASGGLVATLLVGGAVSMGTIAGLVAVATILVRNELSLAGHIRRLAADDRGPEAIVRGARERFAPTVVSAIAIALAMLPLVVLGNRPGLEIAAPIAVAVVGGLVSATLLTLFVTPALYFGIHPVPEVESVDQVGPVPEPQVAGVR